MRRALRHAAYSGVLGAYTVWRVLRNRAVLWLAIGLLAFANYQHSKLIDHLVWEIKAVNMKCDVLGSVLFRHLRGSFRDVPHPGEAAPKSEPDRSRWRVL